MCNKNNYSEDNYKKLLSDYKKQTKRLNSILSMNDNQEFKMLKTNEILNNYKDIIDESSIVSKTNSKGYGDRSVKRNDWTKFCER